MYESLLPERARLAYRLSRWKTRLDERAGTLLARCYSPNTVGRHLCEWVDFTCEYEDEGAVLPSDVRSPEVVAYLDRHCKRRKEGHLHVRAALRLLLHDEGEQSRRLPPKRKPVTKLYVKHVSAYLDFKRQHRGCRSSRAVEWRLREFFGWLDGRQIEEIGQVGPVELRDFIGSLGHLRRSTVAVHASVLRGLFRYLGLSGVVRPGLFMAIESPRLYRMSSPPPILDEEVVERLLAAVDRTTPIGRRDYAMLVLAARYGMRPCEIRGLRLDDIHWREQRIVMVQSKTQRPLELPLLAEVDEALVDYLSNARPASDVREVFLRHVPPFSPFVKTNNLWDVMQRAFDAAGIAPPPRLRGMYLLRHSAATRMLDQGAPFDTISDVLGHASVETTRIYAQVDLRGLRSVALSAEEVC